MEFPDKAETTLRGIAVCACGVTGNANIKMGIRPSNPQVIAVHTLLAHFSLITSSEGNNKTGCSFLSTGVCRDSLKETPCHRFNSLLFSQKIACHSRHLDPIGKEPIGGPYHLCL